MGTIFGFGNSFFFLLLLAACGKPGTDPTTSASADPLIRAVKAQGAASADGAQNSLLCKLAGDQAQNMASTGNMSHDGFSDRASAIRQAGGTQPGEIVAYTSNVDPTTAASDCASSWRNSPGHWTLMQPLWDNYCYGMAKGADGYYCIGLFSNSL